MFSPRATPSPWRLRLERAADTAVAFATLESITSVRDLLGGEGAPAAAHPHRVPLRPTLRPGRPGVVSARPHVCTIVPVSRARTRDARRAVH